jgi:hypothetical protein
MTIQWKCNEDHASCEARDWQFYKEMPDKDGQNFLENIASNSRNFEFRAKPENHEAII